MNNRIIVAHPGKQHSYQTAKSLYGSYLYKYITSVYLQKRSLTYWLFHIAQGKAKIKIGGHRIPGVKDSKVVLMCELQGVIALVLAKMAALNRFYVIWNNHLNDSFGKKVAKYAIKHKIEAVISYDYNSAKLFEIIKKKEPGIKCILDVSIATRPFMQQMFLRDIEQTNEQALKTDYPEIWDKSSLDRVKREIKLADYFFAPSQVVKKSLVFSGVYEDKIKVIPYGVDCTKFDFIPRQVLHNPLKLIFVGQVNYRKGIHHLLKVVNEFSSAEVDLNLIGAYDPQSAFYKKYKDKSNIHFLGFMTQDNLSNAYHEADVFVFPTLGEGFGMVLLEAMSCGLPVIVSDLAGGNDAITNGVDGFEFTAGNDDQLKEKIQWFLDNPDMLPEMSINARRKAEKYTWDAYYEKVNYAVKEILAEKI